MGFKRVAAARVGEMADDSAKLLHINGREIALFKRKGRFFALANRCPHQGGPLGEGHFEGDSVLCPWHHWDFHLETGRSRLGSDVCVRTYPVEVEGDQVFVLAPQATSPK